MKQPHVLYKVVISTLLIVLGNLHLSVNAAEPVLSFDGNDYVMMDAGLYQGLSSLTLSAWVRTDTIPSDFAAIAGQGYLNNTIGFGFFTRSSEEISFQTRFGASMVNADAAFDFDNTWHHLAGVRDSATDDTILYIDGVEAAREHGALTSLDATSYFGLGSRADNLGEWRFYFNGAISEVRLWDHARSQEEIQDNMNRRLFGDEPGLLAYWPLDEGEGATAYDNTANGADGSIINASWIVDTNLNLEGFITADPVTGSMRFTNTNKLDVVMFPCMSGYNEYQITEGGALPVDGAWISTNTLPDTVEFTMPGSDTEVLLTAWLTNSPPESVELQSFESRMLFTTVSPVPAVKATYTRGKAPGQDVVVNPREIDNGSTGGTTGGEEIPIRSLYLRVENGPVTDSTLEEPFITVSAPGTYQVTLTVTNAAGNAATSTSCEMTVEEITSTVFVWEGNIDNDWFEPLNWDLQAVPFDGAEVIINDGADVVLSAPTEQLVSFEMTGGTLTFTNWTTCITADNILVSGGTVTLSPAFTNNAMSNRVWFVCDNFTLSENAVIDAAGKGYKCGLAGAEDTHGHGPGGGLPGGTGAGGASYGGFGGPGYNNQGSLGMYGAPELADMPGSGGGGGGGTGGSGGGAVRIEATGRVCVDGVITADGVDVSPNVRGGGGSGGSVFISCGTFAGVDGIIRAIGGTAPFWGGDGSGGRVAVVVTDTVAQAALEPHRVAFSVNCGSSTHGRGYADIGSLYFNDPVMLDGQWMPHTGSLVIPDWNEWTVSELNFSGWLRVSNAVPFFVINVAGDTSISGTGTHLELYKPRLFVGGDITVDSSARWTIAAASFDELPDGCDYGALVSVVGALAVGADSFIFPQSCVFDGCSPLFRAGGLTIAATGGFNADARGFLRGINSPGYLSYGYGPGHGYSHTSSGSGAGYGGRGGRSYHLADRGDVYGSPVRPLEPGSGGAGHTAAAGAAGGNGGGIIRMEIDGSAQVDGILSANGEKGRRNGGGSGGAIFIQARHLTVGATALLSAVGGDGFSAVYDGAGGGGRISVCYGDFITDTTPEHRLIVSEVPPAGFEGTTSVLPGAGYVHADCAEPGTVRFVKVLYPKGVFFFSF